jgi:hypothetical protein
VKSIFLHPAIYASFASLVTLYAYAGFVEFRKIWMLVFATFGTMTIFMAARRRAIGAAVTGLAMAFAWSLRHIGFKREFVRSWLPVSIAGLVIAVIFLPGLLGLVVRTGAYVSPIDQPTPPPGVSEPPDSEGPTATRARSALYGASVEIAIDQFPLGAGVGRFGSHMSRVEFSPLYEQYDLTRIRGLQPDNSDYVTDTFWPMVLGEMGVFGVIAYVTFLGMVFVALWRGAGLHTDPLLRAFALGSIAVFVSAVVESLATPMFVAPPRAYMLFVAIGAAVALARQASAAGAAARAPG